jgi:integrase
MRDQIGKPRAAAHTLSIIRAFLEWCIEREYLDGNPASRISQLGKLEERSRVLTDAELKAIWRATFAATGFPEYYGAIVRTLLLSASRRNEVASMTTAQLGGSDWLIPASVAKNGRAHLVHLTNFARN